MTGNMEDDDDFGNFGGGPSRLSSLFPSQTSNQEDVNQSLIFVPPKQPKKTDEQSSLSLRNYSLIEVVSAYTYKLDHGAYSNQGKLGVAILGDIENFAYKLLLYTGKKQQVALSTINPDFKFVVEPNWYAKFTDDKGDSWSVKFSTEEMLIKFSKQVALARANTCGKILTKLVIQDLVAGEGATVEPSDSVAIFYTAWFFKNRGFAEMFEENKKNEKPFVVKLGKGNAIKGLCDGLVGAQKNMKRLLIIPSSLAYGSDGLRSVVPPNQSLIYEVVVKKIKTSREVSNSPSRGRTESEVKPDVPARSQSVSDDSIRSRGASISEQLTQSPRKDNAKLISRMAKIGMPSLPLQGAIAAQTSSESEAEKEIEVERRSASPKPVPVPPVQSEAPMHEIHNVSRRSISSPRTSSPLVQTPVPQHSANIMYPTYPTPPVHGEAMSFMAQPVMAHPAQSFMAPVVPGLMESHLPLLVSETRTQSTEIRMLLGKLNDKLDCVMPKLEEIKSLQNSNDTRNQAPFMESAVLSQNIERIIQENTQLKKENESKSSKIQELNEKICDILQRNQRFFEESNSILEQRSDSLQMTTAQLQSKLLSLEQDKVKLSSSLTETVSNLHQAQQECIENKRTNAELSAKLETSENNVKELQQLVDKLKTKNVENSGLEQEHLQDLQEQERKAKDLKAQLEVTQEKLKEAQEKLDETKEKVESLKRKMAEMDRNHSSEVIELKEQLLAEGEKVLQCKKKYDSLLENTRLLKNKYDTQMESLVSEIKEWKRLAKSREPSDDFSAEIRKAMNMLYKVLQSEVVESQTYTSAEILKLTLSVIRRVSLPFIGKSSTQTTNSNQSGSSGHSSRANSTDYSSPQNDANVNCDKVTSTAGSVEGGKSSSDPMKSSSVAVEAKEKHAPSSIQENNTNGVSSSGSILVPSNGNAKRDKDEVEAPVAAISEPVTVVSKSETDISKPGADESMPDSHASMPEAGEPQPDADVSKPDADVSNPDADASKPDADASKPDADASKPEADASKPDADAFKPDAYASKPEADVSKPDADESDMDEVNFEQNQFKDGVKGSTDPGCKGTATGAILESKNVRDSPDKQLCDDDAVQHNNTVSALVL